MTDRLRTLHARIEHAASKLAAAGLEDLAAAAYPASGDGPQVSSSGRSDPTGTSVTSDTAGNTVFRLAKAGDYQMALKLMEDAAKILEKGARRVTPTVPEGECATRSRDTTSGELVACTGLATHGDRCSECAADWRTHRGIPVPPEVVAARNARRPRWCGCGPDCCPRDDKGHTSCPDRAEEGRTLSRRCRQKQQTARDAARALGETG